MKLELKHLAPYLPYELRVSLRDSLDLTGIVEKVWQRDGTLHVNCYNGLGMFINDNFPNEFKLILLPMSDLHCDFEIEDCNIYNSLSARSRSDLNYSNPSYLKWSYEDIQILLEHHFDVFGLIENGLAISIHDVEQADA